MSRLFLFALMVFTFIGCGVGDEMNEVGGQRKFEPMSISPEDYGRILAVCNAIKNKEAILPQMVQNSAPFPFEYGEKTCAGESIESYTTFVTKIKAIAQDYEFARADGQDFAYRNVETSKVGLMVDVCNNLPAKTSPIIGSNGAGIWFGSVVATKTCQSSSDATCMLVEFGRKIDQDNYQIHTREWIKFNIRGAKEGFFTERRTYSAVGCAAGLQLERAAFAKWGNQF